jgi:hypothetical protein
MYKKDIYEKKHNGTMNFYIGTKPTESWEDTTEDEQF